jgi:trigger factor
MLKAIGAKEGLTVGDDEVENQIREMAVQRAQDYEALRKSLDKDDLLDNIQSEILNRKTYEFLEANAKVNIVRREKNDIFKEGK